MEFFPGIKRWQHELIAANCWPPWKRQGCQKDRVAKSQSCQNIPPLIGLYLSTCLASTPETHMKKLLDLWRENWIKQFEDPSFIILLLSSYFSFSSSFNFPPFPLLLLLFFLLFLLFYLPCSTGTLSKKDFVTSAADVASESTTVGVDLSGPTDSIVY